MKKLLLLIFIATSLFAGMPNRFGNTTLPGDYTFPDSTTLNKLTVQGKAAFEDTTVFDKRIIGRDATKADSFRLYDDGTNTILKADNSTILLITGTDTVKIVNGAVKPKVVTINLMMDNVYQAQSGAQNTIIGNQFKSGFVGFCDSLVCDSVFMWWNAVEDTNLIDSISIKSYGGRTYVDAVILQDGTDKTAGGTTGHKYASYTGLSWVISTTTRFYWQFKPGRESAANKAAIRNLILYTHPK